MPLNLPEQIRVILHELRFFLVKLFPSFSEKDLAEFVLEIKGFRGRLAGKKGVGLIVQFTGKFVDLLKKHGSLRIFPQKTISFID